MVVDDSRLVKVRLEDVLEGADYRIVEYCRNGGNAVKRNAEMNSDLATMDIRCFSLPGAGPPGKKRRA